MSTLPRVFLSSSTSSALFEQLSSALVTRGYDVVVDDGAVAAADVYFLDVYAAHKQLMTTIRALSAQTHRAFTVVCVSSVCVSEPFDESSNVSRRPRSVAVERHFAIERAVVTLAIQPNIRAVVAAVGLIYGKSGGALSHIMSAAFDGGAVECIGAGNNVVPLIHVDDAVTALIHIGEQTQSAQAYYVLTDRSRSTQLDIVRAISAAMGVGAVEHVPMIRDDGETDGDLTVNALVDTQSLYLHNAADMRWKYRDGIAAHIDAVRREYESANGVTPIRLCVLGAPLSGKSTAAQHIATHYGVTHVTVPSAIDFVIKRGGALASAVTAALNDPANIPAPPLSSKAKKTTKKTAAAPAPRLRLPLLTAVIVSVLTETRVRKGGWILDGYPRTEDEARALWGADSEAADPTRNGDPMSIETADNFGVTSLQCGQCRPNVVAECSIAETSAPARIKALSQVAIRAAHNDIDGFNRRLSRYNSERNGVIALISESMTINTLPEAPIDQTVAALTNAIHQVIPHTQTPTQETTTTSALSSRADIDPSASTEDVSSADDVQVNSATDDLLNTCSIPMRSYLLSTIVPTLLVALTQLNAERPDVDSAVDRLAHLMLHSSRNND